MNVKQGDGKNNRKNDIKSYGLYFFLYCPLGVLSPLIGQYLSGIGFSGTQVGTVTSLGTASAVFAGMFWGKIFANSGQKRKIIAFLFFGASAFALLGLCTTSFLLYAAIYAAMYFFQGPAHGLCDSLVIENGQNFPVIRSCGAVGYAVAVCFAGTLAEKYDLSVIFYIYAITFVIAAAFIMMQKEPPAGRRSEKSVSIRELIPNRRYRRLLICAFLVVGTNISNSTYFGYLFREGGGSVAGIGVAFLLMAGSEAPFMFLIPYINRKISSEKLLLIAMFLCVGRFGFYAFGPSYRMLLATFFLQGISEGIILVEIVKYFGKIVEPRLASIAVSTYYALGNSLSIIVCSFVGGLILDGFGARGVYFFFAVLNILACALYTLFGLYKRYVQLAV